MTDRLTQIRILIHRRRYQRNPLTYKEIADEVANRYGDGSYTFTPGQLALILQRKWDPEPEHIRNAYRLGPRICKACGHKPRTRRAATPRQQITPAEKWWRSLEPARRHHYIQVIYDYEGL